MKKLTDCTNIIFLKKDLTGKKKKRFFVEMCTDKNLFVKMTNGYNVWHSKSFGHELCSKLQ